MRNRRGQDASSAAILVVIIAVMIVLYLVFIPEDRRMQLLGDEGAGGGGVAIGGGGGAPVNILLSQTPGTIYPPAPDEVEHSLPSFTIFTSTDAKALKATTSLLVKNGVFSDSTAEMTFSYDERDTENVMLSFNAKETDGRLLIRLNGEVIFNGELTTKSPPPISLPEVMLKPMNEIVFEANSPGAAFWRVNKHDLVNVIVSGEVTDRSAATSDQHFSIPSMEYEVMNFAELRFLPNCDAEFTGRLNIDVNGQELFSGYADCGVPNKIEIAKGLLESGDNILTFNSGQGQYLVDLVKITSRISAMDIPVFYFNLPPYLHEVIYFNDALLFISIRFTDMRSLKGGVINLNGFETSFQTGDLVFQTQVDPEFLLPGPNSIMIIPQGVPIDVAELRVEVG